MKTAQRILDTAAGLFNQRGERNVSASDVASELGISPGNLYYHFKGKDGMLSALFLNFYREIAGMLAAPITEADFLETSAPLERSWLFLTVIMEAMYAHRFFYFNMTDLMQRYPDIDRGMRRLMSLKRRASRTLASELLAPVGIAAHPQRLDNIADSMTMTLSYWLSFDQWITSSEHPQQVIHRGVLQILSHCAPYLGDQASDFYHECELINTRLLAVASA